MAWRGFSRRTRNDLIRGILLVGLGSALAVYFTAAEAAPDALGDPLETSKIYRRSMEMYGGAANLVATDLREGFLRLWHGRALAGTLAVLTLAAVLAVHLASEPGRPGGD